MKKIRISILLTILVFVASPAVASMIDLGVAGEYNTFILNDYSNYSDVQGALAVGGSATVSGFSVGGVARTESGSALVVGGSLSFSNGTVNGDATVGGGLSFSGATVNGDLSVGGSSSLYNGTINGDLTTGGSVAMGGVTVTGSSSEGSVASPVDWSEAAAHLENLASDLSGYTANGATSLVDDGHTLQLSATDELALQIFNVSGEELWNCTGLSLVGIPLTSTIVINVSGESAGLTNLGMWQYADYASNILFNFYEAETLELSGVGIFGSILAPDADIENAQGVIYGTLIASSFSGGMQQNYKPFDGGDDPQYPVPEPATFLMLALGLLGLSVFARRWRR